MTSFQTKTNSSTAYFIKLLLKFLIFHTHLAFQFLDFLVFLDGTAGEAGNDWSTSGTSIFKNGCNEWISNCLLCCTIYTHIYRTTYTANHYASNNNHLPVNFAVKPHAWPWELLAQDDLMPYAMTSPSTSAHLVPIKSCQPMTANYSAASWPKVVLRLSPKVMQFWWQAD